MNLVNLNNIKKNRTAIMGLAILWVIAFHYSFFAKTPLSFVPERGYLGVDIFILLSSFGLCFSLKKDDNYANFITRRLKRIIPTWWLLITVMLVINILLQKDHPHNLFQTICYYSGIGWWFFYNEPYGIYYYEWYIPTLLAFYFFTPFLYKLNNKRITILFIASIIGAMILGHYRIAPPLSMSYFRIPTYIYGVILYKMYSGQIDSKTSNKYLNISSVIGITIFLYAMIFRAGECTVLYSFMFSMPLLFSISNPLFVGKFNKFISFIGTLTLELYLLHIYNLPLKAVMNIVGNITLSTIIAVTSLIGIAYMVSYIMNDGIKKIDFNKLNWRKKS